MTCLEIWQCLGAVIQRQSQWRDSERPGCLERARSWSRWVPGKKKPSRKASRQPRSGMPGMGELPSDLNAIRSRRPRLSPGFLRTSASIAAGLQVWNSWARAGCHAVAAALAVAVANLAVPRRSRAARAAAGAGPAEARPIPPRGVAGAGRPAARQVWARGGGTARGAVDLRTTRDAEARAGCGEVAGKRGPGARRAPQGLWGAEGREAARRRAWGAEARSGIATRARPHARAARDPRARREAERGVRAGALSAGESPRCPRITSNSGCFGNFPGAPPVQCTETRRAVKTHSRGFVCFLFVRWAKDEGC